MPEKLRPIQELAALLQEGNAEPVIVPSRLAPSAIYDVEYRTAIVALVFDTFALPPMPAEYRKVSSTRLKLLQFITIRPWLMTAIKAWSDTGRQGDLAFDQSIRIRGGFLSDTAHDDVISYLIACGILRRSETQIVSGAHAAVLTTMATFIVEQGFFASERAAIKQLKEIKITNEMLEGW
jgi:hypothetical protein